MELIKNKTFGGERPLFGAHDVRLEDITITDGESGIKCCKNLECHNSKFYGKYPWWHVDGSVITNCYFAPESRSAIWYSDNMVMKDCTIDGPKFFREMKNLELERVNITDADETFWKVDGLKLKDVKLHDGTIHSCSPRISTWMAWRATRSTFSNTARTWRYTMPRLRPRTASGSART